MAVHGGEPREPWERDPLDGLPSVLLTRVEMARADILTIEAGTPGIDLMERAGAAVAERIQAVRDGRPVLVLAGPGNNGGDGYVAARLLAKAGVPVTAVAFPDRETTKKDGASSDARIAADRWRGPTVAWSRALVEGRPLVVDALFGAGLGRPIEGEAADALRAVSVTGAPVLAVDVPSGLDGDTGRPVGGEGGAIAPAVETVTFCRLKPGHVLEPGRGLCGRLTLADIGIPDWVVDTIVRERGTVGACLNGPGLFPTTPPTARSTIHKFERGHALVVSGAEMIGAARLAALAARRVGAGLVTIAAPASVRSLHMMGAPGTLVVDLAAWPELMGDPRISCVVIGPGAGVFAQTRELALDALTAKKRVVLDADAISAFARDLDTLARACAGTRAVLTPHGGEFSRIFGGLQASAGQRPDKLTVTRLAARKIDSVVLHKGADTVIAAPSGRAVINRHASPHLATAGAGDVLAGVIGGLLAQGTTPFEAAAAGAWLHGDVAMRIGPGLIAEDLIDGLPDTLRALARRRAAEPTG